MLVMLEGGNLVQLSQQKLLTHFLERSEDTMFYLLLPSAALCNSCTEALSFKVNEEATRSAGGAAGPNRWFL